jgi:hypothetical protein
MDSNAVMDGHEASKLHKKWWRGVGRDHSIIAVTADVIGKHKSRTAEIEWTIIY